MKELVKIFQRFQETSILVVGDSMLDEYVWGNVERISPEAPVPVVHVTHKDLRLGGAANVAVNLRSLGINTFLCSIVGEDEAAHQFAHLLEQAQISNYSVVGEKKRKTIKKTRVIGHHQHLLRIDEEELFSLTPVEEDRLISRLEELFEKEKIAGILIQDYDKGLITPRIFEFLLSQAKEKKLQVWVDPKKNFFLQYKHISLLKPNLKEFREGAYVSGNLDDKESFRKEAFKFQQQQDIQYLMVTLSEYGIFVSDTKEGLFIPAVKRDIADVSGAGDTVISVAAACLSQGMDIFTTARICNIAGGLVCEKPGVVPVDKEVLLKECEKHLSLGG